MRKIVIFTLTIGLFFVLDLAAIAHNQVIVVPLGGKGYEPQNPLVIPAAEFRADGDDPASIYFAFSGGYFGGTDLNYGCMMAPAYLPDGVTVTQLSAIVYDNEASRNISVDLRGSSIQIPREPGLSMATAISSGSNPSEQNITDSTINSPLIDEENYTYYVTTCLFSSSIRLYAVKVHYSK